MNNAKEYLKQIGRADSRISSRLRQLEDLESKATAIGGMEYDRIRVKSSGSADQMADEIAAYTDLQKEINVEIDAYIELKDMILKQIYELSESAYIDVLSKHYTEYKTLEDIAEEMGYSYDRVRHIHGLALLEFNMLYKKQIEAYLKRQHKIAHSHVV